MARLIKIVIIIVLILTAAGFAKDTLIKTAVTIGAEQVLGTPVRIGGLSLGIIRSSIHIRDFKMCNPSGFPEETLVDIPEIRVDYDLPAILKKNLHLRNVTINLNKVVVIKNRDGLLNVDSLKVSQKKKQSQERGQERASHIPMQIDRLNLTIREVVYEDYTVGEKPKIQAFDIRIEDRTYSNITSAEQLATLIIVAAMKETSIKGAAIYGATALAGVAFVPAGVATVLMGKDSSSREFAVSYNDAFNAVKGVIERMGSLTSADESAGLVRGSVSGSTVTARIKRMTSGRIDITVSARKLILPKPDIAGGVLHEISAELR